MYTCVYVYAYIYIYICVCMYHYSIIIIIIIIIIMYMYVCINTTMAAIGAMKLTGRICLDGTSAADEWGQH